MTIKLIALFTASLVKDLIITIVLIMSETTTIQITTETRDELKAIGKMGESYNSVIWRLIAEHNCNKLIEEGQKLIRGHRDEFVNIDDL